MGMFNSIRENFNAGKERARNEAYRRKDLKKIIFPFNWSNQVKGKFLSFM